MNKEEETIVSEDMESSVDLTMFIENIIVYEGVSE